MIALPRKSMVAFQVVVIAALSAGVSNAVRAQGAGLGWRPVTSATGYAGAVNAISFDPRNALIVVAATDTGGLWRSTDGGAHWASVAGTTSSWKVTSLARYAGAPDLLYAGSSTGLLRSIDNGSSWMRLAAASATSTCDADSAATFPIDAIVLSPDGGTLLAATSGTTAAAGIRRSVDGGMTWQKTLCGADSADVVFATSGRAFATRNSGSSSTHGVAVSDNGGASWSTTLVAAETFRRVAVAPGNASVVYLLGSKLYRSTDGGSNFTLTSTRTFSLVSAQSAYALWIDPTNSNVIVTGDDNFARSIDGGATWTAISDQAAAPITPGINSRVAVSEPGFDGATNRRLWVGSDTGLSVTENIAVTPPAWTTRNNGLAAASIASVSATTTGPILALTEARYTDLDANQRVRATQDVLRIPGVGGPSVARLMTSIPGSRVRSEPRSQPRALAAGGADGSTVFAAYLPENGGALYRSLDGGTTFTAVTGTPFSSFEAGGVSLLGVVADPLDANRAAVFSRGILIGRSGAVYRTNDAAAAQPTWSTMALPAEGTNSSYHDATFDPADSSQLWVAGTKRGPGLITGGTNRAGFWTSGDFTASSPVFTELPSPIVHPLYVSRMTRSPSSGAVGCLQGRIGVTGTERQFWCTADRGVTWARRTDPGVAANAVVTDPANPSVMFVASDTGVYQTADGGVSWSGNSPVTSFPVSSLAWQGRTLVAGTLGRGVWTLDATKHLIASPGTLRFRATKTGAGGAITSVTPGQVVTAAFTGTSGAWTASADQPWIQLSRTTGSGNSTFTVSIVNPGNVIGGSTALSGLVTVTPTDASVPAAFVSVELLVDQTGGATAAPVGALDTPADGSTGLTGSIAVTGWALDDVGVSRVDIYRNCVETVDRGRGACGAPAAGFPADFVYVGSGNFVPGSRPDVESALPTSPQAGRAGWGYLLLSIGFPDLSTNSVAGGQGTFILSAFARDEDGHSTLLGSKTIALDNRHATKPFGTIDTPDQGGTIPGPSAPYHDANAYPSFGWAVTQAGKCIDVNTTASYGVAIDGVFRTLTPGVNWFAGLNRSDIAAGFAGLCNATNAVAAYYINASALGLGPGLHSLGWMVRDDGGNEDGIGSRFFMVGGSSLVEEAEPPSFDVVAGRPRSDRRLSARIGFDDRVPFVAMREPAVRIASTSRVVLDLGGSVEAGYHLINGEVRALPVGSTLDAEHGLFYWQPGVGFLGTFDLVFTTPDGGQVPVAITLVDATTLGAGLEMTIDIPQQGSVLEARTIRIAGWALDPRAVSGTGIATIHTWAYRRDVEDVAPQFLGVATLDGSRPDVTRIFGASFAQSGYEVPPSMLTPGVYDIVVYAWSARTGKWEDARSVRVTVK